MHQEIFAIRANWELLSFRQFTKPHLETGEAVETQILHERQK
jgi:hypothetical protein